MLCEREHIYVCCFDLAIERVHVLSLVSFFNKHLQVC